MATIHGRIIIIPTPPPPPIQLAGRHHHQSSAAAGGGGGGARVGWFLYLLLLQLLLFASSPPSPSSSWFSSSSSSSTTTSSLRVVVAAAAAVPDSPSAAASHSSLPPSPVFHRESFASNTTTSCPQNCSGNGRCLSNGTCVCSSDWYLASCSEFVGTLSNGTTMVHVSAPKTWFYFLIGISSGSRLTISASTNVSSLPRVYIGMGSSFPTNLTYLYSSLDQPISGGSLKMDIDGILFGTWRFSVYSSQSFLQFNMTVTSTTVCPNDCSGNGICKAGSCSCKTFYENSDCSGYLRPLKNQKQIENEEVFPGKVMMYTAVVTSATRIIFTVSENIEADRRVSVCVSKEKMPSTLDYFACSPNTGALHRIEVTADEMSDLTGTWYIGVFGQSDRSFYSVLYNATSICVNNCNKHGLCADGICQCDAGWTLIDCSASTYSIEDGTSVEGKVGFDSWNFFSISLQTDALEIMVGELNTRGEVWVFARKHDLPSMLSYDYKNNTRTRFHRLFVPADLSGDKSIIYVGVTGSPFAVYASAKYILTATVGCNSYSECTDCTSDNNCGWCWSYDASTNSRWGSCLGGDISGPGDSSVTCANWLYDRCVVKTPTHSYQVLVLGVSLGVILMIAVPVIFVLIWRYFWSSELFERLREGQQKTHQISSVFV